MTAAGGHRDDAFKDVCVLGARYCKCVVLKNKRQQSSYSSFPSSTRRPPLLSIAAAPSDGCGAVAAGCFVDGVSKAGRLVASAPNPFFPLISSSSSCFSSYFFPFSRSFSLFPSDVPLHVQGQVVRPGETPAETSGETGSRQHPEFSIYFDI